MKKRFIAGALCPKCGARDTIVTYQQDQKNVRECVECGFIDELRFTQKINELETRVNLTEETIEKETQVVRILDVPPSDTD